MLMNIHCQSFMTKLMRDNREEFPRSMALGVLHREDLCLLKGVLLSGGSHRHLYVFENMPRSRAGSRGIALL
jgi:hypothetical protein